MKKILIALLFLANAAFGDETFELTLWRGETLHSVIPENIELRELNDKEAGLKMRTGHIKVIQYHTSKYDLSYKLVADKVVWGDRDGVGPTVIEITASPDAKVGVHKYGLLHVKVIDRVLPPPSEWTYLLDLWQHPWAIARVHKVKPFSKKFWKVARPVYETLSTAGQKFITATIVNEAWNHQCYDAYGSMVRYIKCADGSVKFDYDVFDKYIEFAKSCGIGPYIACYSVCPWGNVHSYEDEKGHVHQITAPVGSKAHEEYWGPFLSDFAKHLKEKGWFEDTYIAMDERAPNEIKGITEMVRKYAPGIKISLAGNRPLSDFKDSQFECYSQYIENVDKEFFEEVNRRKEKGLFLTSYYVCSSPVSPNTFYCSKQDEAFWLGYYPVTCGMDGFLRWAWNSWGKNPDEDGTFMARIFVRQGNFSLCYPDGSPSWRFLILRRGIVAAEKQKVMKSLGLYDEKLRKTDERYGYETAKNPEFGFKALADMTTLLLNRETSQIVK